MNVHIRTGGLLALLACLAASLIGCSAQAQPVAHTSPRPPVQGETAAPASPPRAVGWLTVTTSQEAAPLTVFYPSADPERPVQRGPFNFQLAPDGAATPGNGRLVVISHGSGGGPWVHMDLARRLVQAGFVVAIPLHKGDNHQDDGTPGPQSWERRPAEVSAAIDAVAAQPRLADTLQLDRVGVYGQSAGGHTALSLAGGAWSPGNFRRHCDEHIAQDFNACVGLATQLRGDWLDSVKLRVARQVLNWHFDDDRPRTHHDPRIAAAVSAVPAAADFDMRSLERPRVPLGLVLSGQDRWLTPRWHGERVLAACQTCELLARLPQGGHSIGLSPLPPGLQGLEARLLNDPPGFDRATELPKVDARIVDFFSRHLGLR
jgi:predicted dienelactone hydrolase